MKTQVIQLDRHDDVTSINDKISWSKASRVLLVWPRRGNVLDRPLDLLLIQRACLAEGVQLACVTDDDDLLDHAKELGIPVFRSAKVAQRLPWRRQRQKKILERKAFQPIEDILKKRPATRPGASWQNYPLVRLAAVLAGLVSVLSMVIFLVPEAKITLNLTHQQQHLTIPVYASPEIKSVNLSGGLPVATIDVIVEGQETLETTGSMQIPEKPAAGRVQFSNLTDRPLTIPAGTLVQTVQEPIIQFETMREETLPGKPGATVEVLVQAQQIGSMGNLRAKSIQAVVGSLGAKAAVTNLTEMSGGRDLTVATAASADAATLRERLIEQLKRTAIKEIESKTPSGSQLFPQTLELVKVLNEKQDPAFGLPADLAVLTMRIEFQAWTVREDDLAAICRTILDANLENGKMALNSSLQIQNSGPVDVNTGQIRWTVIAARQVQTQWSESALIRATAGKSAEEGQKELAQFVDLASPPMIELTPSWWPVAPLLPGRIQVVVQ